MIRSGYNRNNSKKRATLDPKKRQFASALYEHHEYGHRLNFYRLPPTAQITLEEFEEWAIVRLKGKFAHLKRVVVSVLINKISPVGARNLHFQK